MRPVLKESGIVLIRLVTLTSPKERLKKIIKDAEGFIYAVTVKGTTGTRESFEEEVGVYLQEVKALSSVPVLAGFGISTPEHVKQASSYCDGVIVGSKIIDLFEEEKYEEMEELISSAKTAGIR
ncbi:tryptophan synthase subunit alpha [Peribacillus psychrosaccharolyticus]|uniref:tryptophan synthase subunit alpha n=1 Tax=Peribacillus psychrosaccharolyticus TaxID=1407 RepID=UPI0002E6DE4E|nr:tryptophan synthase subunit alpha [Peribacillus psychrosaccharolyticus]